MNYLQNHIWCSESNWGSYYDCRHLITITLAEDLNALTETVDTVFDHKGWERNGSKPDEKRYYYHDDALQLKQAVIDWLTENVADRNNPECTKGWCVGSGAYQALQHNKLSVFFHRKRDAMRFVKTFSKYPKPVYYCQYFTDVRKRLDLDTLKYTKV